MNTINLVVRKPDDDDIISKEVTSTDLDKLVTNNKLYTNDLVFVEQYLETVPKGDVPIIPLEDGLIFIDMQEHKIHDSQGFTGVNKLSPGEIKMSKRGNIVGETRNDSIVARFKEFYEVGKIKGFEEWYDSGTSLNVNILNLNYEKLLTTILETNVYGQFVFDTSPYKIIVYDEYDPMDQQKLKNVLENVVNIDKTIWNLYIERLNHVNK